MGRFSTVLVGVTFEGRQERIAALAPGQKLFWRHEKENRFDENAMRVFSDVGMTQDVGHIRAALAKKLMDRQREKGCSYEMFVEKVTGGGELRYGVVVTVMTTWMPK